MCSLMVWHRSLVILEVFLVLMMRSLIGIIVKKSYITMQEADHYYDFFWPHLGQNGYQGVFAPKPTSGTLETRPNPDGCALFVNSKRLKIISTEVKTLALSKAELKDGELNEDARKIQALNQVGLIVVCELLDRSSQKLSKFDEETQESSLAPPIIIGTTHLKSLKTELGERFRKRGIEDVLNSIQRIYQSFASMGRNPAVLLTGDLNAIPKQIQYPPLTYQVIQTSPFNFRSVYNDDLVSSLHQLSCQELYTSYKARNNTENNLSGQPEEIIDKRCVDYIFYMPYRHTGTIRNELVDRGLFNRTTFLTYRKGLQNASILKRIFAEVVPSNRRAESPPKVGGEGGGGVAVTSDSQIGISSLLRFSVYFLLLTVPTLSLFTEDLEEIEQFLLFLISFSYLIFFEQLTPGTIFKPFIKPKFLRRQQLYEPMIQNITATGNQTSSAVANDTNSNSINVITRDNYLQTLREKELLFFTNVALWSQQLQPLLEYGHPGFQPIAVLDLYAESLLGETLLPSQAYPSDHLAIAADLELLW